jgi:4-hydroxy-tetrahydrodipicolinate synthase
MSTSQSPTIPRGIIPPLVTPLRSGDELDVAGLQRLIEHVLCGHVHGLFILGTTGEGPHLSYRLCRELIGRTCELVRRRVPVLVGISDTSLVESLKVAGWAADAGADALVAAPPYYFAESQAELQQYFHQLASAAPLPLVLYNMPAMTKVVIEPDTVRRAMDHSRIVGLKDSSANFSYLHQVLRLRERRTDWRVLVGDEETLAYAVQAGADGGVHGGANVFPKLFVQFYEAAAAGDLGRMEVLRALVVRFGDIYRVGPSRASSSIQGIKCALSLMGVCDDFLAAPLQRLQEPERSRVRQILDELTGDIEAATKHHAAPRADPLP